MSDGTQFLEVADGRLAYEVSGAGPLVVLGHGIGDNRTSYRFLAPLLADAGYRVACVDLRGHGQSSTGWDAYTRTAIAGDLTELIRHLGGPAVIVGHSFSGGAATVAAAQRPELVTAIVEIAPVTRPPTLSLTGLRHNAAYRRALWLLGRVALTGSTAAWTHYLDVAYPGVKPADWSAWLSALRQNLDEPGRMKAVQLMARSTPADAEAELANVRCPALIIMGRDDPDWPDPEVEAAGIVKLLPAGLGRYVMVDRAGHYPHVQRPQHVADAIRPFVAERVRAADLG